MSMWGRRKEKGLAGLLAPTCTDNNDDDIDMTRRQLAAQAAVVPCPGTVPQPCCSTTLDRVALGLDRTV